jgi:hypothetical protein
MKDIGPLKTILGIEVTRNSRAGTLTLTQHLYILDLIKRFGLQSNRCKHNLPMRPNLKLSIADCPTTQDERDDADTMLGKLRTGLNWIELARRYFIY